METIVAMAVVATTGTIALVVWFTNYRIQTNRLLNDHQRVWDEQKKRFKEQGLSEIDIDEFYMEYLGKLMASRGAYGACFPRR